ncbi:MAG: potassium channel family protein [Thermodesulfobacteriota bacterium]
MGSTKNLFALIVVFGLVLLLGTAGYTLIEGWGLLEAFYMTIITVTTVGYGEIHTLSRAGRIFTILVIFLGYGLCLYVAGSVVQFMVDGKIRAILGRKKLDSTIKRLRNHYIVCGYGRIGRVLTAHLLETHSDLVVIEENPALVPVMEADKVPHICASAILEETLIRAGIEHARVLIAALATDTDNVFLVLTARQLNPGLFIMARAGQESTKAKLRAAGADKVESPYDTGAHNMAMRVLRPTVTSFLDLALAKKNKHIQMEEIPISADSRFCGQTLSTSRIRQEFNLIIIAIEKSDGTMIFNPSFDAEIRADDTLIVVGSSDNLERFGKAAMAA